MSGFGMNPPEGEIQRCTDSCSFVSVDLRQFVYGKRIVLRCDTCGRLWPLYHQWIHRLDPQPSDPPSIPGSAKSSEEESAEPYSFAEWTPWLIFGIGGALACFILFIVAS